MIGPSAVRLRWRPLVVASSFVLLAVLPGCAAARARVSAARAAAVSASGLSSSEQAVVNEVNRFRAEHGMGALAVNQNLEDKARLWVSWMAAGNCGRTSNGSPAICHSDLASGITVPWSRLEENVGEATPSSNLAGVLNGLEHSPEHVANMLNGQITSIGTGVVVSGDTVLVAEEFMG